MNKKEVLEIRKTFQVENNALYTIRGCYVDGEKNICVDSKQRFSSLPEEDEHKYVEIFKKGLSGVMGKNLLNMEFPLEEEQEEGGKHDFLMRLRNSGLDDDDLVTEFYRQVIEYYAAVENYYIVLVHGRYDVPGKASSGEIMEDASGTVYDFILCCICPSELTKAGLGYNQQKNCIEDRFRDWIVDPPANAFLFPAFTDRTNDIHSLLYYSKKPEELQYAFIDNVLGCRAPMSAGTQKENFMAIMEQTLGDEVDYETFSNIHDTFTQLMDDNKDNEEPYVFTGYDVKNVLLDNGIEEDRLEDFDRIFEEQAGEEGTFLASNVVDAKKFKIETADVEIKVNPDALERIETRRIDGKECLVITVDDRVTVNGMSVRTMKKKEVEE